MLAAEVVSAAEVVLTAGVVSATEVVLTPAVELVAVLITGLVSVCVSVTLSECTVLSRP